MAREKEKEGGRKEDDRIEKREASEGEKKPMNQVTSFKYTINLSAIK